MGAFHSDYQATTPKYYVEIGDKPQDIFMRSDIPNDISEAHIRATVIIEMISDAEEFDDKDSKTELLNLLGIFTSVNGKRMDLLTRAYIGDMGSMGNERNASLGDKLSKMFGNNKNE
jgi:hypothetical protein